MRSTPKLLSLDLSSKTGFAFFVDGKPQAWGTLFPDKTTKDFGSYPGNFVTWAKYTINRLFNEVILKYWDPDVEIVSEETNSSKQSLSQKQLEYLHFCLNERLQVMSASISYVRSGEWRKFTESKMSKEEKALNAKIARIKKQTGKKLAKIDGKVVGRKGRKHVAIRRVQELFGIEMQRKDEDAADGLLLGLGYLRGAPVMDGTTQGGKSQSQS
jgi:hypothetical protein